MMQALTKRANALLGGSIQRFASGASLVFTEHGRAEDVLQLVNPDVGSPGEKEVLVRMLAVRDKCPLISNICARVTCCMTSLGFGPCDAVGPEGSVRGFDNNCKNKALWTTKLSLYSRYASRRAPASHMFDTVHAVSRTQTTGTTRRTFGLYKHRQEGNRDAGVKPLFHAALFKIVRC